MRKLVLTLLNQTNSTKRDRPNGRLRLVAMRQQRGPAQTRSTRFKQQTKAVGQSFTICRLVLSEMCRQQKVVQSAGGVKHRLQVEKETGIRKVK